ncbi:cation:proton antiporter [Campylobacter mucosalis]|uniref:cation:proton antiporter n=1 Tax=Campylobacter mucosalis TaxID=202 RepID=UPI00146FFFB2|nr:cation:proton antiporter [Campylobacter mucosalis]
MQNNTLFTLISLACIIFLSPYFSRLTRMPIAPIEIILGALASYFGLITQDHIFKLVSEVAFFFLMFLAGMEIDLRMFLNADRKLLTKGYIYIFLLYVIASAITFIFSLHLLFIIIIPIMSVGMIFTLFKEYGKDKEWLNLAMLIASIGEVVSIVLLTIASSYLQYGSEPTFWLNVGYLLAFLALSMLGFKLLDVLFWWFPGFKVVLMPEYDKNEKDIRLSIAIFFSMVALMAYLRLEIAFGAFIAGMFIATFFDHKKDLPQKLGSFGFGFLVPIFFAYIGSTLKLESIFVGSLLQNAMFIVIAMVGARFLSALVFLNLLKFKGVVLYALAHSMPLTLLIAVATIAYGTKNISDELYSSFVLASLIEAIVSMVGIKIITSIKPKGELV